MHRVFGVIGSVSALIINAFWVLFTEFRAVFSRWRTDAFYSLGCVSVVGVEMPEPLADEALIRFLVLFNSTLMEMLNK